MSEFLQLLVGGVSTGAIYALVAIGFTLLWQTSQTINFAQGEFVMLPAFLILAAMKFGGLSFPLAIVVGFAASIIILGLMFKKLLVDPILPQGVLPLVIATIALGIFLKDGVKEFYSAQAVPFPSLIPQVTLRFGEVAISLRDIGIVAIAVLAVGLLQWFLGYTSTGRQMQASAQNPTVARILGIPVERMILYTFVINAILVTLASLLITPVYLAKFTSGETLGLAAFIAAIVGGFNQIRGAIAGGVILGVLENLMATYVSGQYRSALPLILLIVVILVRPQGLFGRAEERSV